MKPITIALTCALMLASALIARGESLQIENRFYTVNVDAAAGTFTAASRTTGKTFLTAGKLSGTGATAKVAQVSDKTFGDGAAVEVQYPTGNRERVALFPDLPFILFTSTLHNGGVAAIDLNRVPTVSAAVDLGKPLSDLQTLGTGGLLSPDKNPGSYAFLAVVDPQTRAGIVGGWITHDRGSGVVFSPVDGNALRVQAQIDYGRLRIKPNADAAAETFAVGYFSDARLGLEAYADAIARIYSVKLPPQPSGFCTWYTEKHSRACDQKNLADLAAFAAKELKPFGFDFVQIDDGWQISGRVFEGENPQGPYSNGMKPTAENIEKLGLTPGIWFIPFAGNDKHPAFAKHQDRFYKDSAGKPFAAKWGGTCLDMSVPETREYLKTLIHRYSHDWGYKLFKMDGLWTGTGTRLMYVNNGYKWDDMGEAAPADPDFTQIEAYRTGFKLVREAAGPKVFLLGCCVSQNMRSFGGAFGLVDAMRVGPDTGAGHIGAANSSRLWFLHNRVWQNDPDCVSVRAATPLDQARVNASFTAISGQLFYNSDWIPDLPAERLDILKRCMPAHGLNSRPVDVFESGTARIWLLTDSRHAPRRDVVALFNWGKKADTIRCAAERIGLPPAKQYVAFDFWANKYVPPFSDNVIADLPPSSCRVLAIRPVSEFPQLLSTSRHLTQGIVDVLEENWDAAKQTLAGVSRAVANDPYELRIIVPVAEKSWRAASVAVSSEDSAAGVKAAFTQDGPKVIATLTTPVSRDIHWQLTFEPARVDAPGLQPVTDLKASAEYQAVTLTWNGAADSYSITRTGGATFQTSAKTFVDTTAPHGAKCQYSVAALGWGGVTGTPASIEVTVPAELSKPAIPPQPAVFLDDLKPTEFKSAQGKPQFGKTIKGQPLALDGKTYAKGLGVHAPSSLAYKIPDGARRFVAIVGIDDEVKTDVRSSVKFEIYGDVKEMGEPPVLIAESPVLSDKTLRSWAFDLELNSRFKELRLVVTDAGDANRADHADWAQAGFIKDSK